MAEDGWPGEKRGEERGEYLRRGGNFMCGIVGYVGDEQAAPILLAWAFPSWSTEATIQLVIAVRNEETEKIAIVKAKGRLKTLIEKTDGGSAVPGTCGIGHTRWATHGEPSETQCPSSLHR